MKLSIGPGGLIELYSIVARSYFRGEPMERSLQRLEAKSLVSLNKEVRKLIKVVKFTLIMYANVQMCIPTRNLLFINTQCKRERFIINYVVASHIASNFDNKWYLKVQMDKTTSVYFVLQIYYRTALNKIAAIL